MYKKILTVDIRMVENRVINKLNIDCSNFTIVSDSGKSKNMSEIEFDKWMKKFIVFLNKCDGDSGTIYDSANIATVEVQEIKNSYSVTIGDKNLEILYTLIGEFI